MPHAQAIGLELQEATKRLDPPHVRRFRACCGQPLLRVRMNRFPLDSHDL